MEKNSTAIEALAAFRKRAESTTKSTPSSGSSSSMSSGGMSVEGPKMTTSFNTPTTGHMGLFKSTGMSNTARMKIGEEDEGFPWSTATIPSGLLAGAGIGGLVHSKGNPKRLVDLVRKSKLGDDAIRELLGPLLIGGSVGGSAGAVGGSYLENRMPKAAMLSKVALGITQPSMITRSLRSAAGCSGGYTAGNLVKGSGAYKPTRARSLFSKGKSSAMDKM